VRPVTEDEGLGAIEVQLLPQRAAIRQWVSPEDGSRGLRLSKVHDLLRRQGIEVAYSSLHRFAVSYCGFHERQRVTVRVADARFPRTPSPTGAVVGHQQGAHRHGDFLAAPRTDRFHGRSADAFEIRQRAVAVRAQPGRCSCH
jgi:hypothetical protein